MSTLPTEGDSLDGALARFLADKSDSQALLREYGAIIDSLVNESMWSSGSDLRRRVLWTKGKNARLEYPRIFARPGLYLWGVRKTPLYVGITRSSFRRRFGRYIWQERSQCNLAQLYEAELCERSLEGFPEEVKTWYKGYRGAVRLRGAVAFAKHGINEIWFVLFPHNNSDEIVASEKAIVPVAQEYNRRHGYPELLNAKLLRTRR